jgi:hypothetical protein
MLVFDHCEQENIMNFRLIGAAALSLVLATPAMAMHHRYHHNDGQVVYSQSPVRDALENGYRSTYGAYNFYPRGAFSTDYDGSVPDGYDPVPPSANGG